MPESLLLVIDTLRKGYRRGQFLPERRIHLCRELMLRKITPLHCREQLHAGPGESYLGFPPGSHKNDARTRSQVEGFERWDCQGERRESTIFTIYAVKQLKRMSYGGAVKMAENATH